MDKALLIIDMQKGDFSPKTRRFDADGVIERINKLSKLFRTKNFPVIFIQHDGSKMNQFIPNTLEWELLDELNIADTDIFIDKYANDVFYNSNLETKLNKLQINHIYITGSATDFCIESTIQSALTKDYKITVIEDGHTTGERPHLKANQVIKHYNWVWKNMIPTKGNIEVKLFEDIKKQL
ncbi:MAG: isochorismatase family protein [Algibacter sp.]